MAARENDRRPIGNREEIDISILQRRKKGFPISGGSEKTLTGKSGLYRL